MPRPEAGAGVSGGSGGQKQPRPAAALPCEAEPLRPRTNAPQCAVARPRRRAKRLIARNKKPAAASCDGFPPGRL